MIKQIKTLTRIACTGLVMSFAGCDSSSADSDGGGTTNNNSSDQDTSSNTDQNGNPNNQAADANNDQSSDTNYNQPNDNQVSDNTGTPDGVDNTPPAPPEDLSSSAVSLAYQQELHGWGSENCTETPAGVNSGYTTGDQLASLNLQDCDGNTVSLNSFCGADATWVFVGHGW